jgi:hypothetical protein
MPFSVTLFWRFRSRFVPCRSPRKQSGAFTDSKAIVGVSGSGQTSTIIQSGAGSTTLSKAIVSDILLVNAGSLTFSGSERINTATVNGGTLVLSGTGGASNGFNSLVIAGGTLDLTLGTVGNQLISAGSGTLTLSGGTLFLTEGTGFSYTSSYQLFNGFSDTSYSALTISGYDTSLYSASISDGGALNFSAVPEPASYAAIAGVAALGLAVLHRRKRQVG